MRITDRVREIIEMNLTNHYIPLAIPEEPGGLFPQYFGRLEGENTLIFPETGATGIGDVLGRERRALALVADRAGGYEAYLLEGTARYVDEAQDSELVAAAQSDAPGFPVHGAVVFTVSSARLTPPP